MPQIILILDNWISFKNYYPDYEEVFVNICRDSVAVGISVVLTTMQTSGIGYKLLSNFSKRIGLFCNDSGDHSYIFEVCRLKIDNIPGRGIVEKEKSLYECQTYLAFEGEKEYERVKEIKKFIEEINEKTKGFVVKKIPEMPEVVTREYIRENYSTNDNNQEIPIGINFENNELAICSLETNNILSIVGDEKTARLETTKFIIETLKEKSNITIVDSLSRELKEYEEQVSKYTSRSEDITEIIIELYEKIKQRYEKFQNQELEIEKETNEILIVNERLALNKIGENKELTELIKSLSTTMKKLKVFIVFSDIENTTISYASSEILKYIRDNKNIIIFEDIKNIKLLDVPAVAMRTFKKPLEKYDTYYFFGGNVIKIKASSI